MVALVLCFALFVGPSLGWNRGDSVPMMHRESFKGQVSQWKELPSNLAPRFSKHTQVRLQSLKDVDHLSRGQYKLAFSMGQEHGWVTPWIDVEYGACDPNHPDHDRPCQHLTAIRFTYMFEKHSVGRISGFKWQPIYSTYTTDNLVLHYRWAEESDQNLEAALYIMYGFSTISSVVFIFFYAISATSRNQANLVIQDSKSR